MDLLLTTARQTETPLYVVVTMRSDFLGDCDAFYGLPEAMSDKQFLTPRLSRDQAREAIEGPARLFHAEVKPALVTSILNEIGNDPDQLPLMQHALQRTWRHAQGHRGEPGDGKLCLKSEDYEEVGGISFCACATMRIRSWPTSWGCRRKRCLARMRRRFVQR